MSKRRKVPKRGAESISSRDVLDAIRCPVCRDVALPPINQCRNGHVLCKDCLEQLKDRREPCPTCRVPLQHYSVIRCLALEHVASSLSVECPHDGCGAVLKYQDVGEHVKNCAFKPFPCPLCQRWEGPLDDLERHVVTAHDCEVEATGDVAAFASSEGFENDVQGIYTAGDERFLGVVHGSSITFLHMRDPAKLVDGAKPWSWTLSLYGPDGMVSEHTRRCSSIRHCTLEEVPIACRAELPCTEDFNLAGVEAEALPNADVLDEDDVVAAEEDGEEFFCYKLVFWDPDAEEEEEE